MDFNKVGTSKKMYDDAKKGNFQEIGKLKDGVATHRVVNGPLAVRTLWYPTLRVKEGKVVQGMQSIIVPVTGSIFDPLIKMDEELMKAAMVEQGASMDEVKKYRSAVRPKTGFRYLVFDRDADGGGKPVLRPFEYNMQVKDGLAALQVLVSRKRTGMLENGLNFMYDVYITKDKGDGKTGNSMYDTKYTVQPVNDTLPIMRQLQIPADWVNWNGQSDCPWNWGDYFTEEELEAIDGFVSDLETISAPMTETEIIEKVTKQPIYLNAKFGYGDKKGDLMFPFLQAPEYVAQLQEIMVSAALLTQGEDVVEEAPKPTPRPTPKPVSKPIPAARQIPAAKPEPEPEIEDAQIVEDTPQETEPEVVVPAPKSAPKLVIPKPAATVAPKPIAIAPKPVVAAPKPAATATPTAAPPKRVWGGKPTA